MLCLVHLLFCEDLSGEDHLHLMRLDRVVPVRQQDEDEGIDFHYVDAVSNFFYVSMY